MAELEPNIVRYTFGIEDQKLQFEINTLASDVKIPTELHPDYPEWTRLEHNQCACCPLKKEDSPYCPASIRIYKNLEAFQSSASFERVRLKVETARRTYDQECDLQNGLNSMLGLQMATSGCPVVGKLRSMATFHTPFSSLAETLYRSVSAYLTKQYFAHYAGEEADWNLTGLRKYYEELELLNEAFSARIKSIESNDAISNAMIMFFAASVVVATLIDDGLAEYKDYFTGETVIPPEI